ncbi:hypothetical protein A9P82_07835 [Arachidicoccus ginsenosidimutans]|uniref:Crp/Fnr family transcriptional regulator n=1 Tax=Arachidicoccus sp. BS20 TaxID=1850526 RepID=UPI0007F1432A|nr:Crp/Fnr family transcriptional regulator [Arachidicoccus sp. BS20]ANI89209.1 hypothetical protein A9P82_07835 [Arachidicoccus sp. BS20]
MNNLIAHIKRFVKIDAEDEASILSFFEEVDIRRKDFLLKEGQYCSAIYFVVKGLLRLYFVDEKGVEQTTDFAIENWWLTDFAAFDSNKISSYNIQAVERSTLLVISKEKLEQLFTLHPAVERYFRIIYQRRIAAVQMRLRYFRELSREEAYIHFSTLFPEFIQRIPQYLLASYLGFTPEYLSELRRKLIS